MSQSVMAQSQSLSDWLSYLEKIHPSVIDLGLHRVGLVADRLGLRQLPATVVTVGGTNGKGTTCALLEAIYRAAGYRVGVYSSPHLLRYNERVRIQGQDASDAELCQAFAAVEAARGEVSLTFFEFGTLAALWLFRAAAPDLVLLEVGLGGRLDATNLVESDLAVVTSIALDHCDWLGDTREAIASEKAGIYRPGKPAISGEPNPPVTLAQTAQAIGAKLLQVGADFRRHEAEAVWHFQGARQQWRELPYPELPLDNAVTALAVVEQLSLPIDSAAIRTGLAGARLAGRMQLLRTQPQVTLDVAHNPHSAHYLARQLAARGKVGRRLAVAGMLKDKDIRQTLGELVELVDLWFLADLHGARAALAQELSAVLPSESARHCYASVADAYREALATAQEQDEIIVLGSFHTVAEAMAEELNSK
ncbi:MAG: bifunctional tetrahydrofolate synthase/dihydrofolate synthase [Aeromonadaceae bacterium]|nr:bifunctional tetrahydrofolate synthase/dihydrofolate synthase [Aeromonadaceae bacterium]MBP8065230.1 bifunctional tetrahydrofolate synthase/dihydrofolate synthase [Aeromonadaceae bacterium]MBP9568520.1 bifunctional tetrahydrofolate synthase/dihydrofolate synthase [Aeromonadaceae bacterium]